MDIQQYIASGIIEAYVLGIASDEEVRELESLSIQYPEINAAAEEYRKALEQFSELHAVTPPPGLKEQIWSALEQENATEKSTMLEQPGATSDNPSFPFGEGKMVSNPRPLEPQSNARHDDHVVPFTPAPAKTKVAPFAAAIVLLIGSLIFNFVFWNRSRSVETEMASMKTQQEKMLADNLDFKQRLALAQQRFQLLLDPAVKTVVLAGVGNHTANSAMILWDSRSKEVYLSLKNMPPPPDGKQYQLWAIVDGKPVDAGVYALQQQEAMQKMKVIPVAQMFAITLEKAGGSPSPTLDEMYVAGKV